VEYGHRRIRGLVLEKASSASHVTIIARMMGIPMVAGIASITDMMRNGDSIIVDGDHGEVFLRPSEDLEQEIDRHLQQRSRKTAEYEAMRGLPSVTLDDTHIHLHLNIGLHIDAREVAAPDVEGIGLFRTELPYLTVPVFPSIEEQRTIYHETMRKAGGKPVIFRTFDIRGDKPVPFLHQPEEQNPAMGWRATRIGLDRPLLLRRQLRALLEAAAGVPLSVMFPMIATTQEFDAVMTLLEAEQEALQDEKQLMPSKVRVGAMLEVPSLLFELDSLLERVDFVSIGSNDLMQFMFAADRDNELVASRYDPLRTSMLKMLKKVAMQCENAGVELSFCGDMATRPLDAMALLGCGIRHFSLPPAYVGPFKAMLRSLDLTLVSAYITELCDKTDRPVRAYLKAFAADHTVEVDSYGQSG
ncbi:MAG: peptidase, partial [Anaerolineae bacterium]|nr:peptidase [Anaerolineae bacterium]